MDGISAGAEGSEAAVPVLRTDAERNRKRIVDAARSMFRAEGLDASMASLAREAGVGIATLIRRFPAKEDLAAAVFAGRMDAYATAVVIALSNPDLGRAHWVHRDRMRRAGSRLRLRGRAHHDVSDRPGLEERRDAACAALVQLIDRAKAARVPECLQRVPCVG